MHSALVLIATSVMAGALTYLFMILRRVFRKYDLSELTPDWFENFSVASYTPMEGLLAAEDFEFLSRQPGFDLSLHRKLRRERLHIFRQYLNCLIADFGRLDTAVRIAITEADTDQSDALHKLMRLKFTFAAYVLEVELSYVLCVFGLGRVNVRSLIANLELIALQLSQLPASQTA